MIVITGAAGFIGSRMVRHLNESGRDDLVLVDDFPVVPAETHHGASIQKEGSILSGEGMSQASLITNPVETCYGESLQQEGTSLQESRYLEKIPRDFFFDWLAHNQSKVDFIIHLGSEIDTLPEDVASIHEHVLEFSQCLWSFAAMNRIPLLYAASSADNTWRFLSLDENSALERRRICEQYKQLFDNWVLKQRVTPPLWAGFSMAEVYGPGEYNMGSDASSVMRILHQIHQCGELVLPCFFVSESAVDEVFMDRFFVKDVVTVFTWFMNHLPASGFYPLVTAYPRPLSAVAKTVFSIMNKEEKIEFFPIPGLKEKIPHRKIDLPLNSLKRVGYKKSFTPLEKGVRLFVQDFLKKIHF